MPWFTIDEEFYNNALPEAIARLRARLREENPDLSGIQVCKDLAAARTLLEWSNRQGWDNELVVVRSAKLAELKGTIPFAEERAAWLGYDVVSLGHWSLLRDGLFTSPAAFPGWDSRLNAAGLVPSPALAAEYARTYAAASREGLVEELPRSPYGIDAVELGRVRIELDMP